MDEDTKTLLAVLALVYGSSNGIGLFKDALDEVKTRAEKLREVDRHAVARQNVRKLEKAVLRSLWLPRVIAYIVLVLAPVAFLAVVVWHGPHQALTLLGLTAPTTPPAPFRPSPFYWGLLVLILLASLQLLSPYLAAWGTLIGSWRKRQASPIQP